MWDVRTTLSELFMLSFPSVAPNQILRHCFAKVIELKLSAFLSTVCKLESVYMFVRRLKTSVAAWCQLCCTRCNVTQNELAHEDWRLMYKTYMKGQLFM
jgi:hypothetical protein